MALNDKQLEILGDLFETNQEFKKFATQLMSAAAREAEDKAKTLRSFTSKPQKKKVSKATVSTKEGSSNTPPVVERAVRPDWRGKIQAALKGSDGLLTREIQERIEVAGASIPGGTLSTYLYGMKKDGVVVGDGNRGKTRYNLA